MKKSDFDDSSIHDALLDDLASKIIEGNIAVVVGPELSIIKTEKKKVNLYDALSPTLKEKIKKTQDWYKKWNFNDQNWDFRELTVFKQKFEKREIAQSIKKLRDTKGYLQFLDKLAEMDFDTYISVTPDGWLTDSLERKKGRDNIHEFNYNTSALLEGEDEDLKEDVVVLNLFSSVYNKQNSADYAGSNIEILEWLYSFFKFGFAQEDHSHPVLQNIIHRIREKSGLLFIGCDFPDGLFCLLCRVLNFADFRETGFNNFEVSIAHRSLLLNPKLSATLENFNAKVYVDREYFNDSTKFVRKLHAVWSKKSQANKAKKLEIFLSFSSEDREKIKKVYHYLVNEQGMHNVWFDDPKLRSGDNYDDEISKAISNSKVFIMFLSKNTIEKHASFFLKEWHNAMHEKKTRNPKLAIMLFTIDDAPMEDLKKSLPDGFQSLTIKPLTINGSEENLEDFYDEIMKELNAFDNE